MKVVLSFLIMAVVALLSLHEGMSLQEEGNLRIREISYPGDKQVSSAAHAHLKKVIKKALADVKNKTKNQVPQRQLSESPPGYAFSFYTGNDKCIKAIKTSKYI